MPSRTPAPRPPVALAVALALLTSTVAPAADPPIVHPGAPASLPGS